MAGKIYIGSISNPLFLFENANIEKCEVVLSSSLSGDELAVDQLMPTVYSAAYIRVRFIPKNSAGLITADGKEFCCYPGDGFLDKLPYATPIWYYFGDVLMGKFYSKQITRSGKTWFDILAVSAAGILDGQRHYGGIYTGQTFQTVASEIIGSGFPFSCASDVAAVKIYGWLPIATRRENLHQLLFACGVSMSKDSNGDMYFCYPDSDTVKNVPDNRMFLGGNVDYLTPATRAEVTEHSFLSLESDETVTLFDNTQGSDAANHTFVSFQDEPVHNLSVTGTMTLVESGVNYAIVNGIGTLTGKKYTHTTRVLQKSTNSNGDEKEVSVTDATLVNVANSENVLSRVLSYYSSAKTTSCDLIVAGEKPGDQLSFTNPYEEAERAFLSSMDIRASSFLRASCELVTGYLPTGNGNNFTSVSVLTGSGSWTVPAGVTRIRVSVIQGGHGGHGGARGTDGGELSKRYKKENGEREVFVPNSTEVGVGGNPGTPGTAGKVFSVTIEVTPGQVFQYYSGVGGIGGAGQTAETEAQDGTEGTHSSFGDYSSENGSIIDGGYLDIINNILYAATGQSGTSGSPGNIGGQTETSEGGGVLGGKPASGTWVDVDHSRRYSAPWKSGGGGQGGNAYGSVGAAGETMVDTYETDYENKQDSAHGYSGADGGDGAKPIKPTTPTSIGNGGGAGHGGGGGGTGAAFWVNVSSIIISTSLGSSAGKGGDGGDGGDGAPGGIIIYM